MRIGVYLGEIAEPQAGGGYVFQQEIIEHLIAMNTKHTLFFFYKNTFNKQDLYANTPLATFINLSNYTKQIFWYALNTKIHYISSLLLGTVFFQYSYLNRLAKKYNIQILYSPTPVYEQTEIPTVFTMWDLGDKVHPYFPETSLTENIFERRHSYYSKIIPKALYVMTGNKIAQQQLCKYYNIAEDRIIINPMITPSYVSNIEPDNTILQKLHLEKEKYLFYPAQFWAHKNHIRLIKAMEVLKEKGFKLVLTGSDKGNKEYLQQEVRKRHLEDCVIFSGFITQAEIIALYQNAFALTYASCMGPDNIPPLEAMTLKCPVICANYDGAKEQLKEAALYFDTLNEQQLIECVNKLQETNTRNNLIEKGKTLSEQYSVKNYVQNVLDLFDKVEPLRECWQ